MGYERRANPALLFRDRERFLAHMTSGQRRKPANMAAIVAINQGRKPLTRRVVPPVPLPPPRVAGLLEQGHTVLDTRSSEAFGAGHVAGALHAHLSSSQFEQRAGWVVPVGASVVLVTTRDADVASCMANLAFVGMDQPVVGYLEGGMEAWIAHGLPVVATPQISPDEAWARLSTGEIRLLDVREQSEWDEGHAEGALFRPYHELIPREGAEAPGRDLMPTDGRPLAVVCAGGLRSSTAISLLLRQGYSPLLNVTGGMDAWKKAGLPRVDAAGNACGR